MRIEYVADDGKRFETEEDCRFYEFRLSLSASINDIQFYDKYNRLIEPKENDLFSEEFYGSVYRIYIPDQDAVTALLKVADYTGFCCYADIYSTGFWTFNEEKETFIKG